jgi:hypothetical protein
MNPFAVTTLGGITVVTMMSAGALEATAPPPGDWHPNLDSVQFHRHRDW